jgi:hypothetical protein
MGYLALLSHRGSEMRPRSRTEGLIIRDLPGELLVYDRDSHQAHCLNSMAASVFRAANGQRTVAELASLLSAHAGAPVSEEVVCVALRCLDETHLLETCHDESRRRLIRRIGFGAVLPFVTSLLVPTPAEAARTCIPGRLCPGNNEQPCHNGSPKIDCPTLRCRDLGTCA